MLCYIILYYIILYYIILYYIILYYIILYYIILYYIILYYICIYMHICMNVRLLCIITWLPWIFIMPSNPCYFEKWESAFCHGSEAVLGSFQVWYHSFAISGALKKAFVLFQEILYFCNFTPLWAIGQAVSSTCINTKVQALPIEGKPPSNLTSGNLGVFFRLPWQQKLHNSSSTLLHHETCATGVGHQRF